MSFPGLPGMPPSAGGNSMSEQEQKMVKMVQHPQRFSQIIGHTLITHLFQVQAGMESCAVKTVMAGGMGFALGGLFGFFISSMSYDTPLTPQGREISTLPVREQLRRGFKDMGTRSYSSAKNFALVGAIYSGTECCIEGYRAKNDLTNSVAAGCITGGILARKAGPQAALLGCGGFAAFSAAIDWYMRLPSEPE